MSRVTIGDIFKACDTIEPDDFITYPIISPIEVVPRKMVEMIIEKCRQDVIKYNHDSEEAACIKQYAESLLKQFEEDFEEDN